MTKQRKVMIVLSITLVLSGLGLLFAHLWHPYQLSVDGQTLHVRTIAFSLRGLLRQLNYELQPDDRTSIDPDTFSLSLPNRLSLQRTRLVEIDTSGESLSHQSPELLPANLLQEAGIRLFPKDLLLLNDQIINPYEPLANGAEARLQFIPAKQIVVEIDGETRTIFTQKATLAEALAEAGIQLQPEDRLSSPPDTLLQDQNTFTLAKAKSLTVTLGNQTLSGMSAAPTVGEALAELGLALQNLDRSIPPDDQPLPENGQISLIQGAESITLVKDETAFNYTYQLDPEAELDTTSVITPGQVGLVVSRQRNRVENGMIVLTREEGPWKASDPADAVLGRGTKVVIKTEVVDGQTIEYWRKVSVYATSYHPSEFSYGAQTRSGLPLTKGIVAVAASWYNGLEMQPVYVPGYGHGIIADSGYGIPGRYWIDLGYDDENYVSWHDWTVIYFLTPVPAYVAAILP
ncbi:MAG TPA: ubiquitin-like domain-containing protein [Anaerolineaceae bacterium]|nr:ubiquitin-like domain-containing protein [Anaerolineaceae bacterium]